MKGDHTQRGKILQLLQEREGQWVPSYELAAIALQYGARVLELRRAGHNIENKARHINRQVHGAFRLTPAGGQAKLYGTALETLARGQEHWLEVQPQGRTTWENGKTERKRRHWPPWAAQLKLVRGTFGGNSPG